MHFIIFDLEATCWEQSKTSPNEIIEIGAVLINEQQQIESEFQQFVQPTKHPQLSAFCRQLTSISQDEVDRAPLFPEAVEQFKDWFGYGKEDYCLCSWGKYDRRQLTEDCVLHGLESEWVKRHISLKHQYSKIRRLRKPLEMKGALDMEGLDLEGTHHRGIDDARNIAKIFLKCFEKWKY